MTQPYSHTKISPEFAARLGRVAANEQLRVVVLLRPNVPPAPRSAVRSAAVVAARESMTSAVRDVDTMLLRHTGRRESSVDVLGSLRVTATPDAIEALAGLRAVRAIFEDQPVRPLFETDSPAVETPIAPIVRAARRL